MGATHFQGALDPFFGLSNSKPFVLIMQPVEAISEILMQL